MAEASMKPEKTRPRLVTSAVTSSPLPISFMADATTALGRGILGEPNASAKSCHRTMRTIGVATRMRKCFTASPPHLPRASGRR